MVLSKTIYVLAFIEALLIAFSVIIGYIPISSSLLQIIITISIFTILIMTVLKLKGFYRIRQYSFKDIYFLFEGVFIATLLAGLISKPILGGFGILNVILTTLLVYFGIIVIRTCFLVYKRFFKPIKNILIVGAGQDGKLIAEEIQSRPELGMKVVGFLDDNMNNIDEEDSSIPILGLTYDSEAVIKDNSVDMVIIAVKSRMDSNILTDLAKGIPLGVKVWRMPTFYAHITQKLFTNKMAVNWLFYDYVRPKHILYSRLKKVIDIICAVAILILTLPVTLIAMLGIKFSDFGPIFFTQTRKSPKRKIWCFLYHSHNSFYRNFACSFCYFFDYCTK